MPKLEPHLKKAFALVIALLAASAFVICRCLERISEIPSIYDLPSLISSHAAALALGLIALLFTGAAFYAGLQVAMPQRIIAWTYLGAGLICAQYLIWHLANERPHVVGFGLTMTLSMFIGAASKRLVKEQERAHSQHLELMLRVRELQEARVQLIKHDELERRVLAADLHDQVLNDLKMVRRNAQLLAETGACANVIGSLLDDAMHQIREVMETLCPSVLEHLGLAAAIEEHARRVCHANNLNLTIASNITPEQTSSLSVIEQTLIFRIVQEVLTNAIKHARASALQISARIDSCELRISIRDNGTGFDFSALSRNTRGVRFIRQRASILGASIAWIAPDHGGTEVQLMLDLSRRNRCES